MRNKTKSIIGQCLIILIITQAFVHHQSNTVVKAEYSVGMLPGMMLRLDQPSINAFKNAMAKFMPHFFNVDLKLAKSYAYNFNFFEFFNYNITWDNVQYDNASLDMKDIKLDLTRNYGTPLMKFDFPAIKEWTIKAD